MEEAVGRAAPLPPAERRAAILVATVPLLREHGMSVTTRQIARAAGVAEGTLFRVFPDKRTLVFAAVSHACAPAPLLDDLAAVDRTIPLDERMLAIVELVQARLRRVIDLMVAVRMRQPPDPDRSTPGGDDCERDRLQHEPTLALIAELLEPDRDQLTQTPSEVARLLRLLTFAGTHPGITDHEPLTATEITSVLLDGVRRHG